MPSKTTTLYVLYQKLPILELTPRAIIGYRVNCLYTRPQKGSYEYVISVIFFKRYLERSRVGSLLRPIFYPSDYAFYLYATIRIRKVGGTLCRGIFYGQYH